MHKVAEPPSVALAILVLTTAGFSEVGDRAELGVEWASGVPTVVEFFGRGLSLGLPLVSGVDVADEVVADVVAYVHFEEVATFS